MPYTLKISKELISRLGTALLQGNVVTQITPKSPYETFRFKYGPEIIVIYSTGKIVSTGEESRKILHDVLLSLESAGAHQIVIGSDEAGKGEWLGPMVAASVALDQKASVKLMVEGIMDSKMLNLSRIRELSLIVKKYSLGYKTVTISPSRFNELVVNVKDEGKSLNDLLAWAHATAVRDVIRKLGDMQRSIRIVIDEFDKLAMKSRLERVIDLNKYTLSQYPKAEEEIAVAAASILARDERERWIDFESRKRATNLRSIDIASALRRDDASQFAKVSYLKLGSSGHDLIVSRFLQNVIMLEHMLWRTVTAFGVSVKHTSLKEMPEELQKKGLVNETIIDRFNEVNNLRNKLVHGESVSDNSIEEVLNLTFYLLDTLKVIVKEIEKTKPTSRVI